MMGDNNYQEKILSEQEYRGKKIEFDPDSSPRAWEHFKKVYNSENFLLLDQYDIENLHFYQYMKRSDQKSKKYRDFYKYPKDYLYGDFPTTGYNRLFAIEKTTKHEVHDGITYFEPANRLSGDTDWNFKKEKLKIIVSNDNSLLENLEECASYHHSLVNFSLMQSIGNMQTVKSMGNGDWLDRFDSFICIIDDYYKNENPKILSKSQSQENRQALIDYLSKFNKVYDYFEQHYFLSDSSFIDDLIDSGRKPIKSENDVRRYINLAKKYWDIREKYFKNNS